MILEAFRNGGGHPIGGPLLFSLLFLAGCRSSGTAPERPGPDRGDAAFAEPLEIYRELGMLTGSADYPAVGTFSALAGPADSAYVFFGMSLPNRALRFEREDGGFTARYSVTLRFEAEGEEVKRVEHEETVRISSFAETARGDESILFQTFVTLPPGRYDVTLETRDLNSRRGVESEQTVEVPVFGSNGEVSGSALFVYRAEGRASQTDRPELILNPRKTVPFGAQTPLLYLEGYGLDPSVPITVAVLDDEEREVWRTEAVLAQGGPEVRHALVEIPATPLTVGRHWIEVRSGGVDEAVSRSPLVVTVSDQWMVANFAEILDFVAYIAYPEEVDSLRTSSGAERQDLWERFWDRRNPTPAAPVNEFREAFFSRVRVATQQLAEPGVPGWRTDRGRVFIVLGPPDQVVPRQGSRAGEIRGEPNAVEWLYGRVAGSRLELLFLDRTGNGRFELTRNSEIAFRSAATRLRPRR